MVSLAETQMESRPIKKPRACYQCHSRKVRCDAWQVGVPCTRCRRRNQDRSCALVTNALNPARSRNNERLRQQLSPFEEQVVVATGDVEGQNQGPQGEECPADGVNHGTSGHHVSPNQPQAQCNGSPQPVLSGSKEPEFPPDNMDCSEADTASSTSTSTSVEEDDIHVRIAEAISRGFVAGVPTINTGDSDDLCEIIEYHEGVTPITIVGEALGNQMPNRLTCIKLRQPPDLGIGQPSGVPRLDPVDVEYLERKGAVSLPQPRICNQLLRLYFDCVLPYTPILEPIQFANDFSAGRASTFLMQCILASVIPYTTVDQLNELGFQDRINAQKVFYWRATTLYDFGYERSQLRRLQGSIMLSSLSFSYSGDKDYRYWFFNACRIATQMGLHRKYISERLDPASKKLFRRIWWTLYNRDVLLAVSGLSNLKKFDNRFCDVEPLTEDDWLNMEIPPEVASIVPPTTHLHRSYMIENCKLSMISSHFLEYFKTPGKQPSVDNIRNLESEIAEWKKHMDPAMSTNTLQDWSVDNIWILVLLATSFRLEAVLYRALREHYQLLNDSLSSRLASQKQQNAMFELSAIIQRASLHQVIRLCPLSFMTCASTILAMRIETALSPEINGRKKMATKMQIFTELEYLRETCQYWTSLTWTLRMFETVIHRNGLGFDDTVGSNCVDNSSGHGAGEGQTATRKSKDSGNDVSTTLMCTEMGLGNGLDLENNLDFPELNEAPDFFGVLPVTGNYDWIDDLCFADNV